jgi:hypothetical protein
MPGTCADDIRLFEKLCLEGFRSGLSWRTILAKRDSFRAAFAGFDFRVVAEYARQDVERLLQDSGIVRHRGKIEAVINRADENGAVPPMMVTHYRDRADAGLIITESTPASPRAIGYPFTPGIYTIQQVASWVRLTNAVHSAGGHVFLQLQHCDRDELGWHGQDHVLAQQLGQGVDVAALPGVGEPAEDLPLVIV